MTCRGKESNNALNTRHANARWDKLLTYKLDIQKIPWAFCNVIIGQQINTHLSISKLAKFRNSILNSNENIYSKFSWKAAYHIVREKIKHLNPADFHSESITRKLSILTWSKAARAMLGRRHESKARDTILLWSGGSSRWSKLLYRDVFFSEGPSLTFQRLRDCGAKPTL